MKDLDAIFSPRSVAVVGASTTPGKVGHDIFVNILKGGYRGVLYPVNPNAESIACVRAYPSIADIPYPLDLAMLIVPPKIALQSVQQAIDKGVKGVVIVSAGFKEVGGEGLAIENQITQLCRDNDVRLVGPNCLGVINPLADVRLNASFSARMPKPGNVSFISQSGALCTAVLDFAGERDFGFSKFISIGNKADVDEVDLLRYFQDDPDTEVIMIYVEELQRGQAFIEIAKQITGGNRPKPILVIKSGRTSAGAQAAASHTGSLAGSEAVYDAIFAQSGIIRVERIDELFDYAIAFAYKNENALGKMRRKVPHGNRVAIVTNAGGPGIVATDMTVVSGLELATFSEETVEVLQSHLPATANVHNPVDIIGDAAQDRYERALNAVIRDEGVDGALVILTPQSMTNAIGTAKVIVSIAQRSHKPILCCFMGIVDVSAGVKYLQENGVPVYPFPEQAARSFGAIYRYAKWLNRQELAPYHFKHDKAGARKIVEACVNDGQCYMGELTGVHLLKCYGFDVLPTELALTGDEAVAKAEEMGYPVAMKIVSAQIIHKSDAGGVRINVADAEAVKAAFEEIVANAKAFKADAIIDGVLVQKMAPKGQEVILGATRYPKFGHLLMFGSGGVSVEVFKDVTFRLAPINRNSARQMVRGIKAFTMLSGFRNMPKADLTILEKLIVSLSDLVTDNPEIKELDINPLLVHPEGQGATVADCRFILEPEEN
ncbi:acetate--CoA ligase family protein [Desulfatitalea alkaliphila]|uniref:Acetate--CoA ligase family protein n=1 Tax=Desulfatitalea alkaliphila TaxID=2929485 RepID=A0AA41RDG8_9BACT|nr:acetate--CoA ligase [Desulfatitalea alkaliphila]MCJ8502808.1 acetate--CoA ligase family protein [Desulfatitalea alkaliphila]